jgi:hypothetical protein
MYDLEYFDAYLNQLDLELLNSRNLEIDNYNNCFTNAQYLQKEQDLRADDNKDLRADDKKELTTIDKKELTTVDKKRIRQNKINSASRKCRKKQKIKSKMMDSYITQVHENIKKLYTSLDNLNMQEVITMVHQMNGEMNDYNKNIIKEVNKI